MTETLDQIQARLRVEYPTITVLDNRIPRTLNPEEYEVTLGQWAQAQFDTQLKAQIAADEAVKREQIKTIYDTLKAGTATNAQMQKVVAWLLKQEIQELS